MICVKCWKHVHNFSCRILILYVFYLFIYFILFYFIYFILFYFILFLFYFIFFFNQIVLKCKGCSYYQVIFTLCYFSVRVENARLAFKKDQAEKVCQSFSSCLTGFVFLLRSVNRLKLMVLLKNQVIFPKLQSFAACCKPAFKEKCTVHFYIFLRMYSPDCFASQV